MDPLKSAKSNADKIQELRDELDRLKGIIFASQGIGGKLLDQDVANRSPSDQTSIAPRNSD
jgi:hypothetical protein